jgi:hypothetical protein
MILIVHVLTAAAIAGRVPNVISALLLGLLLGVLIDLIPHREGIHRKTIPWIKVISSPDDKREILFYMFDFVLGITLAIILPFLADSFVVTDTIGPAKTEYVAAAIIGVLIIPLLEAPFKVFGFNLKFSEKVYNFKSKLFIYDRGWSGYIVQVALIVISVVLLTQTIQTPFGQL